jgi:NAD(P)-dependent dehydrogenase (short-subunit alcohol dehydrogenase family)
MPFLDNKTAIITGAGRGIGRALAIAFAEAGAHLALLDRNEGPLRETLDAIAEIARNRSRTAIGVTCDITDAAAIYDAIQTIGTQFPAVDILVNNAAVGPQLALDR